MQLLEKKAKCPLCGAKNPVDAPRCGTCTRPLQNDPLPSQALYDEALWSTKIASKGARTPTNPYAVLALLVVAAVIVNYFVLGFGPSWAHEAKPPAKGFEWKVYTGQPDYRADLPGEPITGSAGAFGTTLTTATVWVDGQKQPKPTPVVVMVTAGNHTVKWKYPDGKTTTKKVTAADKSSQVIKGTLP